MRAAVIVLGLLLCASAAAAGPGTQCRYLERKVEYFTELRDQAKRQDNDVWVAGFNRQIAFLEQLKDRNNCPESVGEQVARHVAEILKAAAKGATTFFTMGAM